MDIELREGLLFTALQMDVNGITKRIDKIAIDTGAAETIISPDAVEDLGIVAAGNDEINSFYGIGGSMNYFFLKQIDAVMLGPRKISMPKIDFGVIDPSGSINGLLGLDLLMEIEAVLDLGELTLEVKEKPTS